MTFACANKFTYVGLVNPEPTVNIFEIPFKKVYTQDYPPEITDIPNLSYTQGDMYTRSDVLLLIGNVRSTTIKSLSFSVQDNFIIKYYRLGVLNLPQGGNHAWIKVALTNDFLLQILIIGRVLHRIMY